ncbi:MAG: cupin domain-containing protein [Candidatus Omnitrophota bacterium]
MEITNRKDIRPFITKDKSIIREIFAYRNAKIKNQSLAEATVLPGKTTTGHFHKKTEEIYYILSGQGRMFINKEEREVKKNDAIAIPPKTRHKIKNTGQKKLVFLCLCAPAYEYEDTVLCSVVSKI